MFETIFSPTSLLPLLGCPATRALATEVLDSVMYGRSRLNQVRYGDLLDEVSRRPSASKQRVVELVERAVSDDQACSETCQALFAYLEASPSARARMQAARQLTEAASVLMERVVEEATPWGTSRQVLHGSVSHHVCGLVNCLASERGLRARAATAEYMRAVIEASGSEASTARPGRRTRDL